MQNLKLIDYTKKYFWNRKHIYLSNNIDKINGKLMINKLQVRIKN